jgi:archaellum component FlaD/FlaE
VKIGEGKVILYLWRQMKIHSRIYRATVRSFENKELLIIVLCMQRHIVSLLYTERMQVVLPIGI